VAIAQTVWVCVLGEGVNLYTREVEAYPVPSRTPTLSSTPLYYQIIENLDREDVILFHK